MSCSWPSNVNRERVFYVAPEHINCDAEKAWLMVIQRVVPLACPYGRKTQAPYFQYCNTSTVCRSASSGKMTILTYLHMLAELYAHVGRVL